MISMLIAMILTTINGRSMKYKWVMIFFGSEFLVSMMITMMWLLSAHCTVELIFFSVHNFLRRAPPRLLASPMIFPCHDFHCSQYSFKPPCPTPFSSWKRRLKKRIYCRPAWIGKAATTLKHSRRSPSSWVTSPPTICCACVIASAPSSIATSNPSSMASNRFWALEDNQCLEQKRVSGKN